MQVNYSITYLIQQPANNALKFHLVDRRTRTFLEVQANCSGLLPNWRIRQPRWEKAGANPEPNQTMECQTQTLNVKAKRGQNPEFCATIWFTFTKLDELWHANGQKWARMNCFFSPKPVGFGSQLCRVDTKISQENPKSMPNCVGLSNQLSLHHYHGTKHTGELSPPWLFIQKASSWWCHHLLCRATCFHHISDQNVRNDVQLSTLLLCYSKHRHSYINIRRDPAYNNSDHSLLRRNRYVSMTA